MMSLEETALRSLINATIKNRDDLTMYIKELHINLNELQRREFSIKYDMTPEEVMCDYKTLMQKNIFQGGRGYGIWIPELDIGNHHMIDPNGYNECLPTDMDKLAYFIINGKHMKVPKDTFFWAWGN